MHPRDPVDKIARLRAAVDGGKATPVVIEFHGLKQSEGIADVVRFDRPVLERLLQYLVAAEGRRAERAAFDVDDADVLTLFDDPGTALAPGNVRLLDHLHRALPAGGVLR